MTAQAGGTTLSSRKMRLRKELRARRVSIPKAERRKAAIKAARFASRLLRNRRHVAVYLSHGSELDTGVLIRELLRRGLRLYLPRLRGARMTFVQFKAGAPLRRNRFGIPELAVGVRAARLDAIVLPLVGFDGAGRRLGQGGGYYDRALSQSRALRVGFAFSTQEATVIPAGKGDARLNAIVTERGQHKVPR